MQQQLQAQINTVNERLTEVQSAQSDSDHSCPEPPLSNTILSVQTKRNRRSGKVHYQRERQRRLTQQQTRHQELQQQRQENKWHRVVEHPIWSEHTLCTEQHTSMAQYKALEAQLRDSVTEAQRGGGTIVERMVQWLEGTLSHR